MFWEFVCMIFIIVASFFLLYYLVQAIKEVSALAKVKILIREYGPRVNTLPETVVMHSSLRKLRYFLNGGREN